jgi:hypothetical protein
MKKICIGLLVIVTLCLTLAGPSGSQTMFRNGTVNGNNVRVREQPSINGKILATLPLNARVKLVDLVKTQDEQYKEWYRVFLPDKFYEGYIYTKYISVNDTCDKEFTDDQRIRIEYRNSEVNVYNNKTNTLIIKFSIVGLVYTVDVSIDKSNLFMAVSDYKNMGVVPAFVGILDIDKGDWLIKFKEDLANPRILCYSPSRRYVTVDTGTSAGVRGITILDLKTKKIEHSALYIPFGFDTGIKWVENEGIQYYQEDYHCKEKIPEPKNVGENHYIKKLVLWDHKEETILKDCIPAY